MCYRAIRLPRGRKHLAFIGIIATMGILLCSQIDYSGDKSKAKYRHLSNELPSVIRILYWTTVFGTSHASSEFTIAHPNGTVACHVTGDRRQNLKTFDLVVFHFHETSWKPLEANGGVQMPPLHPPWQKWVYYSQEPPTFLKETYNKLTFFFENSINAIATYMRSADIQLPYGGFLRNDTRRSTKTLDQLPSSINFSAGKSKLAVTMMSNCGNNTRSGDHGRLMFVLQLQKLIKLDVYGLCGVRYRRCTQKCRHNSVQNRCLTKLGETYKFYLAIENSDCDDYITEKYWKNALQYNMIPVVRGRRNNYEQFAIPGSYIHADRFSTMQDLADYLLLLDRNDTLYNSYFEWKHHYTLVNSHLSSDCTQDLSQLDSKLCQWAVDHWTEAPKRRILSEYTDHSKHCNLTNTKPATEE